MMGREHPGWRGALSSDREHPEVAGSSQRWLGAPSGGGEHPAVMGSTQRWQGAPSSGGEHSSPCVGFKSSSPGECPGNLIPRLLILENE